MPTETARSSISRCVVAHLVVGILLSLALVTAAGASVVIENLSSSEQQSTYPTVAVDSEGLPHVVWCEQNSLAETVLIHRYWTGTSWSPPAAIAPPIPSGVARTPRIAAGDDGTIHLVWTVIQQMNQRVHLAEWSSNTGWSDPEVISDEYAYPARRPDLICDGDSLLVTWEAICRDGGADPDTSSLVFRIHDGLDWLPTEIAHESIPQGWWECICGTGLHPRMTIHPDLGIPVVYWVQIPDEVTGFTGLFYSGRSSEGVWSDPMPVRWDSCPGGGAPGCYGYTHDVGVGQGEAGFDLLVGANMMQPTGDFNQVYFTRFGLEGEPPQYQWWPDPEEISIGPGWGGQVWARNPEMAVDQNGRPHVVIQHTEYSLWNEDILWSWVYHTWLTDTGWAWDGYAIFEHPEEPDVAIDAFNNPVVVWATTEGSTDIFARYFDNSNVSDGEESLASEPLTLQTLSHPAAGEVRFTLGLSEYRFVVLDVYDLHGRRVRHLYEGGLPVGETLMTWDGKDGSGRNVADGIYLLRAKAGEFSVVTRVVLLR